MPPPLCEHPFEANRLNGAADFRADWDIPSAGQAISAALSNDIVAVRSRPAPDPSRRIHLIRGAAGYGKTHLFGRVQSEQGERVQFVFVAAPPEPREPTRYVCWQLVETLFHSGGEPCPRCASSWPGSFARRLPPTSTNSRAGCALILRQSARLWRDDALAVLEVISRVTDLAIPRPGRSCADGSRTFRAGPSGVVLGLSPAADDARAWPRGKRTRCPRTASGSCDSVTAPPTPGTSSAS